MSALAHHQHPARAHTDAEENYVKAIYSLVGQAGEADVSTNRLAERLGVGASSASAMVRKLGEGGLVAHEPYRGIRLTAAGERLALGVTRRHRLLELFLAETLDIPWDRVHREAEILEHHISTELEEAIARKLGNPSHDPHGDPIPTRELELGADRTQPLSELATGTQATFVRISDSEPDMLRWLAERRIVPGDMLEVLERQPFDGPLHVRFGDGADEQLGGQIAAAMRVQAHGQQ
ncbi:MAG: metal-dependent transcriptional regulator [Solirubrobacterales bacterium]